MCGPLTTYQNFITHFYRDEKIKNKIYADPGNASKSMKYQYHEQEMEDNQWIPYTPSRKSMDFLENCQLKEVITPRLLGVR